MVDNDSFNELIDVRLARNLVVALRDRHQGGTETDGQVVGVHHVVLTVLRQAGAEGKEESFRGHYIIFLSETYKMHKSDNAHNHKMSFLICIIFGCIAVCVSLLEDQY